MTQNPFVNEIIRIIREKPHNSRDIILVSHRFSEEAKKEVDKRNAILGITHTRPVGLLVDQVLCVPIHWLTDYEFEIRPPCKEE